MPTIILYAESFSSIAECSDAAHLLAVTTGQLVKGFACGGLYFECFGYGVRMESVPYVPYYSGYVQ